MTTARDASKWSRYLWRGLPWFVVAVACVGVAWSLDGWLLGRLRLLATDTFSNGDPQRPSLLGDAHAELQTYSPVRLARHLWFPSAQVRSVVCLSLGERFDDHDPARWVGVIPKLLVLTGGEDPIVCDCATNALRQIPCVPAEDVAAVLAFVERADITDGLRDMRVSFQAETTRDVRISLLAKTCADHPDRLPWAIAFYLGWLDGPNLDDQRTAFGQLLAIAPAARETLAAFRRFMDAGDPNHIGATGGRSLLARYPALIDAFLDGNPAQRELVWSIAAMDANSGTKSFLTEAHLKRLEPVAVERFKSKLGQPQSTVPVPPERSLYGAYDFLRRRPNGAAILFDVARQVRGKQRAEAINYTLAALSSKPEAADAYLDELLKWLREDDADVQGAVMWFLNSNNPKRLAHHQNNPDSPAAAAARWMLDTHPGREDLACLDILFRAFPTLREEDVDRIANAVYRLFEQTERRYVDGKVGEKGVKSYGRPPGEELQRRLAASPQFLNRPAVKRCEDLRKSLEAKNIIMSAADRAELIRRAQAKNSPSTPRM